VSTPIRGFWGRFLGFFVDVKLVVLILVGLLGLFPHFLA